MLKKELEITKGKKRIVVIALLGGLLHMLSEILDLLKFIYNLIF